MITGGASVKKNLTKKNYIYWNKKLKGNREIDGKQICLQKSQCGDSWYQSRCDQWNCERFAIKRHQSIWVKKKLKKKNLKKKNLKLIFFYQRYKCNISDPKAVNEFAKQVRNELGDIDILINNAGIVSGKNLFELSDGK